MAVDAPRETPSGASRDERMQAHCRATVQALYKSIWEHKEVVFRCTDGVLVPAHKFVLATQCKYFENRLYARKGDTVERNSIVGKCYRFQTNSATLKAIFEYMYIGSIAALRDAANLDDDDCEPLLKGLLSACALDPEDGLGGLLAYVTRMLRDAPMPDMCSAMHRLTLGMEHQLQAVVDAVLERLPCLEFQVECFEELDPEALELVLRDVPLPVKEVEVCRAVAAWAEANYICDSSDSFDGGAGGASVDSAQSPLSVPAALLALLDLSCVSVSDLESVVEPLRLFPERALKQAFRTHALEGSGMVPSRVNTRRGQQDHSGSEASEGACATCGSTGL